MWRPFRRLKKVFSRRKTPARFLEIAPDEVLLDARNLPELDQDQFEGRFKKPLSHTALLAIGILVASLAVFFGARLWVLQVTHGEAYALRGENNRLNHTIIFSDRGVIFDRNRMPLAWNVVNPTDPDFSLRAYKSIPGISGLLGYIKYPSRDSSGFYYREDFVGKEGIELFFDDVLRGKHGRKLVETNALGEVQSQSVANPPQAGKELVLTIDARIQSEFYRLMEDLAGRVGFSGGAAVLMDVETGGVVASVSYPEYDSNILTDGKDDVAIENFLTQKNNPFLNRGRDGLYTPGSIVKPFIALGALEENIIDPKKNILSTGSISIPNPFVPGTFTVFKDWKAHGYVDMREAIAVSSDVYFYTIGGGYEDQNGLGISLIEKYMRSFGFGQTLPNTFFSGKEGVIPSPEWKKKNFNGEAWTIGNTYHTAIGQYGFQVAPIQMARAIAAITDEGTLVVPTLLLDAEHQTERQLLPFTAEHFKVVKEGMRMGVMEGTVKALDVPYVSVAGKTGTAELGAAKQYVNSWVVGFFPYEKPRYAFTVLMEKGPISKTTGASSVMRGMLDWLHTNAPEYFSSDGNASTIEKNKRATSAIDR